MNSPFMDQASAPGSSPSQAWRQRLDGARLAREEEFLRLRLHSLYGSKPGFAAWFDALMNAVADLHAARPAALLALDAERAARPDWFLSQQMVGYSAYVDRFAGTLAGVSRRIPHLCELGVRYLHLLPFLKARAGDNDGGFAVADFDAVEPRLGTMAELEQLCSELRAANISLCSDLVLNHVADDHAWALAAKAGEARYQAYFHLFPDRREPDAFEATLGQVFPTAAPGNFTHVPELKAWAWSTFYPYQWDLNYANPAVFAEMALALLRLANRGIEAFRLDSAAYLWKRQGTACMNQPEAHYILQALRSIVNIAAPAVLLKAEAIVPSEQLPPYFGASLGGGPAEAVDARGRECHLAYQSCLMAAGWVAIAEQDVSLLKNVVKATPALPANGSWLTYVRCHDDIGWNVLRGEAGPNADARLVAVSRFFAGETEGSFASGAAFQTEGSADTAHGSNGMAAALVGFEKASTAEERRAASDRLALLYGLALSFGGLPLIYMGDEFAQGNDYDPAMAEARARDSRWLERPMFDEAALADKNRPQTQAGQAWQRLQHWLQLRQKLLALAAQVPAEWRELAHPAVLCLRRGNGFVALGNFSAQAVDLSREEVFGPAEDGVWQDCTDAGAPLGESISLRPWQMRWLHKQQP